MVTKKFFSIDEIMAIINSMNSSSSPHPNFSRTACLIDKDELIKRFDEKTTLNKIIEPLAGMVFYCDSCLERGGETALMITPDLAAGKGYVQCHVCGRRYGRNVEMQKEKRKR